MNPEIKNRFTGETIIPAGKYESLKEAVENSRSDLSRSDLSGSDLSRSYLSRSDLSRSDLSGSDLSRSNLSGSNLSRSNLSGSNLSGSNLDYSVWPLWCGSFDVITDDKIKIQLLYHVARIKGNIEDADLKNLIDSKLFKKVCNKFHRVDECGEIK